MDAVRKQQVEQENQAREQTEQHRIDALVVADYSQVTDLDALFGTLSTADIKLLYAQSRTFKEKVDEFNKVETPVVVTPEEQAEIDAAAQVEADAVAQAEADRIAAEAAANTPPVIVELPVPSVVQEELYDGIEKLGEGSYKLTVDPEDGTPVEVFYGVTQKDCFKKLRKSKASATKELRRRAKAIEITDQLKALSVEVVNYPPPVKPLILSSIEIFDLTEQAKDPVTILEATRKLRQASLSQEECDRQNEAAERQRYSDQYNIAVTWAHNHPEFHNCPTNIKAMQDLMSGLNWAVTTKNLDLAYKELVRQDVLSDPPEEDTSNRPPAQPAPVIPVAAVPAVTVTVPPVTPSNTTAAVTPAPAGALPAARVLRPGSSSTSAMPTRRIESVSTEAPTVVLTVERYNEMPASEAKRRYVKEPDFKVAVDKLIAEGKI